MTNYWIQFGLAKFLIIKCTDVFNQNNTKCFSNHCSLPCGFLKALFRPNCFSLQNTNVLVMLIIAWGTILFQNLHFDLNNAAAYNYSKDLRSSDKKGPLCGRSYIVSTVDQSLVCISFRKGGLEVHDPSIQLTRWTLRQPDPPTAFTPKPSKFNVNRWDQA